MLVAAAVTVVTPHPDYALEIACEEVLEGVELTVVEVPAGFDEVGVGSATQLTIDPNTSVISAVNGSADAATGIIGCNDDSDAGADRASPIALGAVLLMLIGASALVVRRG
jgi:hypothetical protein